MSHFKFKVPELPEDALARRRKASNLQLGTDKKVYENESLNEYSMSARNHFTGQFSVFNGVNFRNCNAIQQIRECTQEDHVQPSTSKQIDSLSDKTNKSNIMGRSFGPHRNQSCFGNAFQSRHNLSDIRACKPDSTSNYSQINCFKCGSKSFRDMNFSGSHNNTSVIKSSTNSSLCYNQGLREMNSSVYADTQNCTSVNNFHQLSCLNDNQNVFGRSLFPGRDSVFPRNVSVNNTQNKISFKQNACESFNGSSVLRSDKTFNINANASVTDVQSVMKSFLQISSISMKEEILNKVDLFGQNLLRMAPDLGTTFIGFAKEIESILEKNTKLSGTAETLLSTLVCTPGGCQQKSIIQDEKPCEQKIMPKNILSSIMTRSKANNLEFITSFTTEKKGEKNSDEKDEFDKLNFSPTPDKKNNSNEINLKEWYPVVVADALAFSGKNEENVAYETAAVKERITNRKVLLADGRICNLVGNLSKAQKYPASITRRLGNGLSSKWNTLTSVITAFQNPKRVRNKKNCSAELDISINTPLRSSGKELPNVVKVAPKDEVKSSKRSSKKEDSSKRKNAGKQLPNVEVKKSQKKNAANDQKSAEDSRVLGVTRSGRVIKRPGGMWTGENFNAEGVVSNCREISKNSAKTDSPNSAYGNELPWLKRKRNAPKSDAVKAKKSKPEEEPQTTKQSTKTEKNKSRRVDNVLAQNIPVKAEKSVAAKKKNQKNHSKKVISNFEPIGNNPWGNEIEEGLEGIHIPDVPDQKEIKARKNNMNVLGAETPPLQLLRNNLRILRSRTPVQSPDWHISQHTRSEVKKFEKLRAQALRKKIPKENNPKSASKKKSAAQNNDIDTFVNWVSQKEVKSPTKCSKVLKYVMPKKQGLQDEESEDELGNTLE